MPSASPRRSRWRSRPPRLRAEPCKRRAGWPETPDPPGGPPPLLLQQRGHPSRRELNVRRRSGGLSGAVSSVFCSVFPFGPEGHPWHTGSAVQARKRRVADGTLGSSEHGSHGPDNDAAAGQSPVRRLRAPERRGIEPPRLHAGLVPADGACTIIVAVTNPEIRPAESRDTPSRGALEVKRRRAHARRIGSPRRLGRARGSACVNRCRPARRSLKGIGAPRGRVRRAGLPATVQGHCSAARVDAAHERRSGRVSGRGGASRGH